MAHVAQPTGVVAFAEQPCIGIGVRYVRFVAAALVLEVGAVAVIVTAVLAIKAKSIVTLVAPLAWSRMLLCLVLFW